MFVNNAGGDCSGPVEEMTEAKWDDTPDVNLKSTFFCIKAALPALRMSRGNIVNVASAAGLIGLPGAIVYCAAKGAVVKMTKAMALAFAPDVRVNCVYPGYVDTDMVRRDSIEAATDLPLNRRCSTTRRSAVLPNRWRSARLSLTCPMPTPGLLPARRYKSTAVSRRDARFVRGFFLDCPKITANLELPWYAKVSNAGLPRSSARM